MIAAASRDGEQILPGMIVAVQASGHDFSRHPHLDALVTRCGWDREGGWTPVPFIDSEAAALLCRHTVFGFLKREGLAGEERVRLLLSWRHSGFSVHASVTVPPDDGASSIVVSLERGAPWRLRAPSPRPEARRVPSPPVVPTSARFATAGSNSSAGSTR